ncbi:PQQ-binding-like beta-propeller repeat protein [Yinghuangia seranimata]|uniref:outer membrane protein assembly factor BamB family protein n=1 Tax=Yinghuangia seranimata TaxID=408067 RepID=UPI00248BE6BF|nr:PQQ-binding-like beta-propeller repeat protein [Yinghuangia seranimata]MDI2130659.1 PQQ-binding-like beta-propeller repeat protein [Yinghuangia seranimata]
MTPDSSGSGRLWTVPFADARSVYAADGVVYASSWGETVALDAATGEQLWLTPGGLLAPPGERTFHVGHFGRITARSRSDAQVLWAGRPDTWLPGLWELSRFRIPVRLPRFGGVLREVVATVGGVLIGTASNAVFALDATSGACLWGRAVDPRATVRVAGPDGPVLVAEAPYGPTIALDPRTGSMRWTQRDAPAGEPVDGMAPFRGRRTSLTLHDAATGRPARTLDHGQEVAFAVLGATGGLVYASTAHGVAAFDPGTGEPRWQSDGAERWIEGTCVTEEAVYICTGQNVVQALDAADGKELWRTDPIDIGELPIPWYTSFTMTVDGDLVLLAADGGYTAAFDRTSGKPLMSWVDPHADEEAGPSPVAVDGRTAYCVGKRHVYAVRPHERG